MRRFNGEYVERGRGFDNRAANIGSVCHLCLEMYVKRAIQEKVMPATLTFLETCYEFAYAEIFGTTDQTDPAYNEGLELVQHWFADQDWKGREVVSTEEKTNYPIPLSDGTILPLTYIMDRVDKIESPRGGFEIEVIDYKTIFWPISAAELKRKIQARIYALIEQIKHPDALGVWVTFDMLRHTKVSVFFSREENHNSWNWLMKEIERILNYDAEKANANPKLNPECGYCAVKATCPALIKNIAVGGIMGLSSTEMVDLKVVLEAQAGGQKKLLEEIDDLLGASIRKTGDITGMVQGTEYDAIIAARTVRSVDPERVAQSVNPEIYRDYMAPAKLTLGQFEKMLKDDRVDEATAKLLRSLISKTVQTPSVKVVKRTV